VIKGQFENNRLVGKAKFFTKGNSYLSLEMKMGLVWGEAKLVVPMTCNKRANSLNLGTGENEGTDESKPEIEMSEGCYLTEDIMRGLKEKKDIKGKQMGIIQINDRSLYFSSY
jgi:hypothetical protein